MQHLMRNIVGTLAVLALVAGCATPPERSAGKAGSIEIWWLGQSAMLITTVNGKVIMIDPWITAIRRRRPQYKNLDALGKLDLILVTHGHGDHFGDAVGAGEDAQRPRWARRPEPDAATLGILPADLTPRFNKGGTIKPFPGVKITQVTPSTAPR